MVEEFGDLFVGGGDLAGKWIGQALDMLAEIRAFKFAQHPAQEHVIAPARGVRVFSPLGGDGGDVERFDLGDGFAGTLAPDRVGDGAAVTGLGFSQDGRDEFGDFRRAW